MYSRKILPGVRPVENGGFAGELSASAASKSQSAGVRIPHIHSHVNVYDMTSVYVQI